MKTKNEILDQIQDQINLLRNDVNSKEHYGTIIKQLKADIQILELHAL